MDQFRDEKFQARIRRNLQQLIDIVHNEKLINFFELREDDPAQILDIFVRANSGGKTLSRIDLMFSTIVSFWGEGRSEIDGFLKTLNETGGVKDNYRFRRDFIIRCCLYMIDAPTRLRLDSFDEDDVITIRDNWEKMKTAIQDAVNLLYESGFSGESIMYTNAILPIIYFRYKKNRPFSIDDRGQLIQFFIRSQINEIYGTGPNTRLEEIRKVLSVNVGTKEMPVYQLRDNHFSLEQFKDVWFGNSNLEFSDDDIERLFDLDKGSKTLFVLALLYDERKLYAVKFDQDHMHPYALFREDLLLARGIAQETIDRWLLERNRLANLQLLIGHENKKKNKIPLKEWVMSPEGEWDRFVPENTSLEIEDFDTFIKARKEIMTKELKRKLKIR
jgi:hypothetical protein